MHFVKRNSLPLPCGNHDQSSYAGSSWSGIGTPSGKYTQASRRRFSPSLLEGQAMAMDSNQGSASANADPRRKRRRSTVFMSRGAGTFIARSRAGSGAGSTLEEELAGHDRLHHRSEAVPAAACSRNDALQARLIAPNPRGRPRAKVVIFLARARTNWSWRSSSRKAFRPSSPSSSSLPPGGSPRPPGVPPRCRAIVRWRRSVRRRCPRDRSWSGTTCRRGRSCDPRAAFRVISAMRGSATSIRDGGRRRRRRVVERFSRTQIPRFSGWESCRRSSSPAAPPDRAGRRAAHPDRARRAASDDPRRPSGRSAWRAARRPS